MLPHLKCCYYTLVHEFTTCISDFLFSPKTELAQLAMNCPNQFSVTTLIRAATLLSV